MTDETHTASIDSMELAPEVLGTVMRHLELPGRSLDKAASSAYRAFYHWPCPSASARATLLIIPGLGEHGGRYAESASRCASRFTAHGFNVCSIDLQGHGYSPGKRGCIESYASLLDDVAAAKSEVDRLYPNLPSVIWGHSMGGNLVINYLLSHDNLPQCAIASGPMLRAVNLPSPKLLWLARQLVKILPNMQLSSSVDSSKCTRDERFQKMMRADKLYFRSLSLRLGEGLVDSGQWAIENADKLTVPLLLVHALKDVITSSAASREFAERSGRQCELQLFEDSMHDMHRDLEREEFYQLLQGWLCTHIT